MAAALVNSGGVDHADGGGSADRGVGIRHLHRALNDVAVAGRVAAQLQGGAHAQGGSGSQIAPGDGLGQRLAVGIAAAGAAGQQIGAAGCSWRDSHTADHRCGVRNHYRGLGILTVVVAVIGSHTGRPDLALAGVGSIDGGRDVGGQRPFQVPGIAVADIVAIGIAAARCCHQQVGAAGWRHWRQANGGCSGWGVDHEVDGLRGGQTAAVGCCQRDAVAAGRERAFVKGEVAIGIRCLSGELAIDVRDPGNTELTGSSSLSVTVASKEMLSPTSYKSPLRGAAMLIVGAVPMVRKMMSEQFSPTSSLTSSVMACVAADKPA